MRNLCCLLFSLVSITSLYAQDYDYESTVDYDYAYGNYSDDPETPVDIKPDPMPAPIEETEPTLPASDPSEPIDLNNFTLDAFPQPFPSTPPSPETLPHIDSMSSIIAPGTSLQDIMNNFAPKDETYIGNVQFLPPATAVGIWWRFYSQNTSVFNIPSVNEEMIIISTNADVIWLQDVKTSSSVRSKSQRLLKLAYFNLMNHMFFVFYYDGQDPYNQKVREEQGFFVRIISEQGFMEMSKNPTFPRDESIYWRYQPQKPPNRAETTAVTSEPVPETKTEKKRAK